MTKFRHKVLLSCLKATQLIEKKLYLKLSFSEALQVKLHTMMCKACSNFDRQNNAIEKALKTKLNAPKIDIEQLIADIKDEIKNA